MTGETSVKSKQEPGTEIIFAAGGIVWRQSTRGPEVAVIHRTLYGDEWCLPKGKLQPEKDKTLEDTAIREVWEETKCVAQITGFAGATDYKFDNKQKVVLFWNMTVEKECPFTQSDEVDKLEWLPHKKAIDKLTHAEEKKILAYVCYYPALLSPPRFPKYRFRSAKFSRLAGSLIAYRSELEYRICSTSNHDTSGQCWIYTARRLLAQAELVLYQGKIDAAWKCFHAAQRMEIFGLTKEELKTEAIVLRQEAEKLNQWRKEAIYKLLGKVDAPADVITHEQVYRAMLLRDDNYDNQAYKDNLLRCHIITLVLLLVDAIAVLIALASLNFISFSHKADGWEMFVAVALFGLFGAISSAATKVPESTKFARIPELVHTSALTFLRMFIGTASAVFIYIFVNSEFASKLFEFSFADAKPWTYYVISFVAGFSERLVLSAVNLVVKEK